MFYHVRITQKSDRAHDEIKLDLTEDQLETRFLSPYREGRPIVIGGKTIPKEDIERIRITQTDEDSKTLLPIIRRERENKKVDAPLISDEWYVAYEGKDVTDEFITSTPAGELMEMKSDLRRHIIALLEVGIKHIETAGLTQARLSEVERNLNLSRNTMRKAIKHLAIRGALNVIEDKKLPYGVIQAFVTDVGKLYYNQLVEEHGQPTKKLFPVEIRESLQTLEKDYPDPMKVGFIMMKFKDTPTHKKILQTIKDTLRECGLKGIRSDDHEYHKDLFYNVETCMHGCAFGISVYDRIEEEEFSPNVSLEVGYMMALGKSVCILKDKNLEILHADLLGKLYKKFDPQDPENTIPKELSKWLSDNKFGRPPRGKTGIYSMDPKDWALVSKKDFTPEIIEKLDEIRKNVRAKEHQLSGLRVYRSKKNGNITIQYDET